MSIKATVVSSVFAPKTPKGYFIFIPKIFHSVLLASKADYPKPPLNTTKITVFGNDFTLPLRAKTDNQFQVTLPEGSFSEIEFEIDALLAKQANYGFENGNNLATFDIFVCPFMGTPPPTIGATIDSIDTNGVKETLDTLQKIIGTVMSDGVPLVTEWKTLKGCTLLDYKNSGFDSSGISTAQTWTLTFHYTYVNPLLKFPMFGKNLTRAKQKDNTEVGSTGMNWDGPLFAANLPTDPPRISSNDDVRS